MDLNTPYFVFDTEFGKVVIEYYYSHNNAFVTGLNDVSTNTYQQLSSQTVVINDFIKDVYAKINEPNYTYIRSPDNHIFTMSGWHINGNFITRKIDNINTVYALLVYYLNHEWFYNELPIFHKMIIAEIVEKYIPEEILKDPKKFNRMLELKTNYEGYTNDV